MGKNRLFYGDSLEVLRQNISAESVDLVYLDPPFNSNRSYNVIFKRPVMPPVMLPYIQAKQAPKSVDQGSLFDD